MNECPLCSVPLLQKWHRVAAVFQSSTVGTGLRDSELSESCNGGKFLQRQVLLVSPSEHLVPCWSTAPSLLSFLCNEAASTGLGVLRSYYFLARQPGIITYLS